MALRDSKNSEPVLQARTLPEPNEDTIFIFISRYSLIFFGALQEKEDR